MIDLTSKTRIGIGVATAVVASLLVVAPASAAEEQVNNLSAIQEPADDAVAEPPIADPNESPKLMEILASIGPEGRELTVEEIETLEEAGEIDPGEIATDRRRSSSCNSWTRAVGFTGKWMTSVKSGCSIAGGRTTKVSYWWETDSNALGGFSCLQGQGARVPASNPYSGGVLYWHAGGCGSARSVTVDWQSSLHTKAVRVSASAAPIAGLGMQWK